MKKVPFILFSLVLELIILAGCGEWLAKREAKRDDAEKQAQATADKELNGVEATAYQMPIDSLIKTKEVAYGYTTLTFDTSKFKFFPDFTLENIFAKPKYKALFGWTDDYTLAPPPPARENYQERTVLYKNIPFQGSSCSYTYIEGSLIRAQGLKFIPLNDPSDVKISPDEAKKIALEQEYYTEKQKKWMKEMKDSLGYTVLPYERYEQARIKYRPNAKFVWEKRIPVDADSVYYPKPELMYIYAGDSSARLAYELYIYCVGIMACIY